MAGPIHVAWFNRPGVGEYGVWRVHGTHQGFDSYTVPKATIYGTADGGKVIGKGHADGWGYYIDVWYPATASRKQYVQRDCHMHEGSGLSIGAAVNRNTALGRVGQTGNAKGIVWIRQGVELWHVHSEVYSDSSKFNTAKRVNPLPVWGATTAGGGTPIIIEPEEESEHEMRVIYNKDAPTSQDATRRAVVGEFTFKVVTGPQSTRERKLWGDPVNVTQGEWDAQRMSVEENRRALGLPILDHEKLAEALAKRIPAGGGGATIEEIRKALADGFAGIPKAVADEQAKRMQS